MSNPIEAKPRWGLCNILKMNLGEVPYKYLLRIITKTTK